MISHLILSLVFAAGSCAAGVVPTAPGPGQSFKEGADCTLSWNLDSTNKWTSFSVDLMSGSNTAMQLVTNVFKDRDGTKGETSYTWNCPTVTPHSAIYFYQFTQPGADTTWTTRFAITSPSGEVTPPANSAQPGGAQVPWGIGRLVGAGAESAPTNTSITPPTPMTNTTALNTPSTTSVTNSTTKSPTASPTTAPAAIPAGNTGTSVTVPTQSTSTSANSNPKTPSPSSVTAPNASSDKTQQPSSGASAVVLGKTTVAALTLATVIAVAC